MYFQNLTYNHFFVPKLSGSTAGFMPFKQQFGFVESVTSNVNRTIAHELGHGAFRLRHTFSTEGTYIATQGETDNLMDYSSGEKLYKYQWDYVHDPEGMVFTWAEEEEEMMEQDDSEKYNYNPYRFLCKFFDETNRRYENLRVYSDKKVAIDPGHGDDNDNNPQVDPGALSIDKKDYEKDIALKISIEIKNRLLERNVKTLMTRDDDIVVQDGAINWRLKMAHKDSCDIFVSIHLNAAGTKEKPNPVPYGFVVLHLDGDEVSKKLAQRIVENQKVMRINGTGLEKRPRIGKTKLGVLSYFKGESSVLVEVGYITNAKDLETMKREFKAIGIEIADGICNYLKYD